MRRDERGQAAADYAGVLAVVALIFVALFALGLHTRVAEAARTAVCSITGASCVQSGAPGRQHAGGGEDTDGDGVPDLVEEQLGSDPAKPDSDDDGLPDSLDPVPGVADADGDGLADAEEVALGSDPRKADTDGDGTTDREEYEQGSDPTQGIAPLTNENAFKPWERVGISEDEWREFEQEILDEINPGGIEGFLFGPSAAGVTLDEDGEIAFIEIQQNGIPVGPLLKGLVGGAKITVKQAAGRAVSRLPAGLASKLARAGVIPSRVPRIRPPAPPSSPGSALGALDDLGRPSGASATITRNTLGTGSRPAGRIKPPGYQGGPANHAKGHLIGRQLGGTGDDARNLVTLYQTPVNNSVMLRFENAVRRAVEAGETVKYTVTPIYRGAEGIPRAITLSARGSKGFRLDASVLNRAP